MNLLNEMTQEISRSINAQKEEIIKTRLKELDIQINLKHEELRLFKDLMFVQQGGAEHLMYNDGSLEGLRVVSFNNLQAETDLFDGKLITSLKYW